MQVPDALLRRSFEEDYTSYLHQIDHWPRWVDVHSPTAQVEKVPIADMTPQHAISAMHKLIRWATPAWAEGEIRRTPLAMRLLEQAVGAEMIYTDDLPQVTAEAFGTSAAAAFSLRAALSEETCFDALTELDKTGQTHPVTRARILASYLNTH